LSFLFTSVNDAFDIAASKASPLDFIHLLVYPVNQLPFRDKINLRRYQYLGHTDGGNCVVIRHAQINSSDLVVSREQKHCLID
jgi:hypothetical protein